MLKNKKNTRKQTTIIKKARGITLIALVVTIIVLLILAGISINMLSGNNGILNRTTEAKETVIIQQEKDAVENAYYVLDGRKKLGQYVTSEELQHELDLSVGANKTQVAGQETLDVLFTDTNHSYKIKNGTVTKTEIFDANDGFYIAGQKASMKIYVPKKEAIVSDIVLKGYKDGGSRLNYCLCELSKINSEYLDVLEDLNYIDDNMKSFIKTKFLNTATDESEMIINGIPMFTIKKVDNNYYLVMEWEYLLDKDFDDSNDNTVFASKVRISSEITFTNNINIDNIANLLTGIANGFDSVEDIDNFRDTFRNLANEFNSNDYTKYTLGDLKVEENIYECSATENVPIKNIIPSAGETITNFSFIYNNKEYENKEGLKDFLDKIVGFNNKDIITTYIMMGISGGENLDYVALLIKELESMSEYYQIPLQIAECKAQNADVLTKYLEKSNELDGLYVKGQRITSKLQHDRIDENERNILEGYMSRLFQFASQLGIMDVKLFETCLNKQLVDPLYISSVVNAIQHGISPRIRNVQIPEPMIEEKYTNYFNLYFSNTCDITMSQAVLGEIHDYDWNLYIELELYLGPETGDIIFDNLSFNPELISVTFYHSYPDEANFEWDDFREKGLVPYLNENILPFPDKDEFWTFYEANKHKLTEQERYNCEHGIGGQEKNAEIDAYIYMYRLIIKEAINSGNYVIKNDGKTYTGTKAFENFFREEYGLNKLNNIRKYLYVDEY